MGKDNEGRLIVSLTQYLGLIVMMSCLFLGMTYWTDGNLISVPITVVLAAIIFILVNFYQRKSSYHKRWLPNPNYIFVFYLLALSIPVSIICLHAINVEVFEKTYSKNRKKAHCSINAGGKLSRKER